jgi:hypothetical protein
MQKSEKLEKFLGLVSEDKSNLLEKMQWRIANKGLNALVKLP